MTFVEGDIRDPAVLGSAMEGMDGVFHEAALVSVFASVENPAGNHEINITGTLNVLEAARKAGVRRVLMAGSAAAYGNNPEMPEAGDHAAPNRNRPTRWPRSPASTTCRLRQLYGLRDGHPALLQRLRAAPGPRFDVLGGDLQVRRLRLGGETPVVFGDGGQTRDFVFVGDIVRANLLAMGSPGSATARSSTSAPACGFRSLDLLDALRALTGRRSGPRVPGCARGATCAIRWPTSLAPGNGWTMSRVTRLKKGPKELIADPEG